MPLTEVVRTYLEMTRPEDLVPAASPDPRLRLERVAMCPASFYRYLYAEVGRSHHWVDRLGWADDQIRAHLAASAVSLWVLFLGGGPAGYFELQRHADGSTEIAYFGLLPELKGRGLGKHLLTLAVQAAWEGGAERVWLHTCTLDDSAAMPNYRGRGFRPFKQETYWTELPSGDGEKPER
jgi:GNAT superfamily N-acetyltransferase